MPTDYKGSKLRCGNSRPCDRCPLAMSLSKENSEIMTKMSSRLGGGQQGKQTTTGVSSRSGGSKQGKQVMTEVTSRQGGRSLDLKRQLAAGAESTMDIRDLHDPRAIRLASEVSVVSTPARFRAERPPSGGCGLPNFSTSRNIRSAVHTERCVLFGKGYLRDGFAVPGWARYQGDRVMDVIVGHLGDRSECSCYQMVQRSNVQTAEIHLSARAIKKGIKMREFFFVHEVRAASEDGEPSSWFAWAWVSSAASWWDRIKAWFRPRASGRCASRDVEIQVTETRAASTMTSDTNLRPTAPQATLSTLQRFSPTTPLANLRESTSDMSDYRPKKGRGKKSGSVQLTPADPPPAYTHYGDHSIEGEGAAGMNVKMSAADVGQNYLNWMSARMGYDRSVLVEDLGAGTMGVTSHVQVNDQVMMDRSADYTDSFNLWCDNTVPAVTVSSRYGINVDTIPKLGMTSFMLDAHNFSTRHVAGAINGATSIPFNTAQSLAAYVDLSQRRDNNISLYAKGWVLALMRAVIERRADQDNAYVPVWNAAGAEFTMRNWGDVNNIVAHFEADVTNNVFVLLARDFSNAQLNCLRHLSRGGAAMADQANVESPALNRIQWFSIPMAVYSAGALPPPPIADFTSDMMRATLIQLATTRGEVKYLVEGFTKALTLLGVKMTGPAASPFWITCTAEAYITFHWPHPSDFNPIWRWLQAVPALNEAATLGSEASILKQGTMSQLLDYGIGTCSLLALGFGLAFNTHNINGRFLNIAANQNLLPAAQIDSVAKSLFQKDAAVAVPPIFRIVCAEIMNVTQIAINAECFAQDAWCAAFTALQNVTLNSHWAGTWAFRIPYVLHPMCTSWALAEWPAVFGIYSGNVQVDLKADVILNGNFAGWYSKRGCGKYSALSAAGGPKVRPQLYIHYGLYVLNALHQTQRRNGPTAIQAQRWGRGWSGADVSAGIVAWDAIGPNDFLDEISTFKPGSIRSYDWETDEIMAPVVPRNAWTLAAWGRLRENGYSKLEAVGLIAEHMNAVVGNALGDFNILDLYGGDAEEGGNEAPHAAPETEPVSEN